MSQQQQKKKGGKKGKQVEEEQVKLSECTDAFVTTVGRKLRNKHKRMEKIHKIEAEVKQGGKQADENQSKALGEKVLLQAEIDELQAYMDLYKQSNPNWNKEVVKVEAKPAGPSPAEVEKMIKAALQSYGEFMMIKNNKQWFGDLLSSDERAALAILEKVHNAMEKDTSNLYDKEYLLQEGLASFIGEFFRFGVIDLSRPSWLSNALNEENMVKVVAAIQADKKAKAEPVVEPPKKVKEKVISVGKQFVQVAANQCDYGAEDIDDMFGDLGAANEALAEDDAEEPAAVVEAPKEEVKKERGERKDREDRGEHYKRGEGRGGEGRGDRGDRGERRGGRGGDGERRGGRGGDRGGRGGRGRGNYTKGPPTDEDGFVTETGQRHQGRGNNRGGRGGERRGGRGGFEGGDNREGGRGNNYVQRGERRGGQGRGGEQREARPETAPVNDNRNNKKSEQVEEQQK